MSEEQEIMDRLEEATGTALGDEKNAELLAEIIDAAQRRGGDMTFQQAMQALERSHLRLQQEQACFAYFSDIINGKVPFDELHDMQTATHTQDSQGRFLIAKVPICEAILEEFPEDYDKALAAITPFFTIIHNFYAKRTSRWVREVAVYSAIVVARISQR